jgi:hypothetical protein
MYKLVLVIYLKISSRDSKAVAPLLPVRDQSMTSSVTIQRPCCPVKLSSLGWEGGSTPA